MRDPETGNSKGFAFINFASFEASDAAIEAMDGQYLCNRQINVSYAFKKETTGERHGTWEGEHHRESGSGVCVCVCVCYLFLFPAERYLAKQNPLLQTDRPHQLFADAPPTSMSLKLVQQWVVMVIIFV